ncbi:MAG: efflux RND transporter periplasmic adaptor subunit [Phenylobacterium sp.]|uniref:efflux RND transporter periplasmic adaptor subunit n=1 Tax=Phenylobacterium sp. TaxID=1871053 RepID=UPI00391D9549
MRPYATLRPFALIGVAGLLAACQPSAAQQQGGDGPVEVGVAVMTPRTVPLTSELSGRTTDFEVSEVRPQVNGVVKARLFEEGAFVKAGQPLYQIDPAIYRAQADSARAALAQAEALLASARSKAERYADLVKENAVSRQDNDEAQAAFQEAKANVAARRAALAEAEVNLAYTRVNAPISGRIGRSAVTAGALVTAQQATPLTTIRKLDPIYVDLNQSVAEMLKLRRAAETAGDGSAEVALKLEDGTAYPLKGKLKFADASVDVGTGMVALRAVFPNPQGALLPGMYVRASVEQGQFENALTVPQAAVTRDAAGAAQVMVVGAGGKAEVRPIKVGQTVGTDWLVASGLKPGDRVIVEGLQKVQPGAPVKPVPLAQTARK